MQEGSRFPLADHRVLLALAAAVLGVWAIGLPVDIMDVDAAQYAHMSRQMLESGEFLQIRNRSWDYLDKPPLHFWLTALSYAVFGVGVIAYKLPSFLFAILGVISTWGLARIHHGEQVARTAALLLASCQAVFMITNDVRTDTVLLGATALALWQLTAWQRGGGVRPLIVGSVALALAMLAKGPIGAMVPVLGLGTDAALKREWRRLFRPGWLLLVVIVAVMLTPMTVGLYQQHGMKGVRFYYWTQSFGRLTGESSWRNDTTPLFFTHTFLWSFLPWSFLFVVAWVQRVRALVRSRLRIGDDEEVISLGGFTLAFLAFSLSRYKLPHYIFVVYPLAAILAASFLHSVLRGSRLRWYVLMQLGAVGFLVVMGGVLGGWAFPMRSPLLWTLVLACAAGGVAAWRTGDAWWRMTGPALAAVLAFNLILAGHFYPSALAYQAPTHAARAVLARGIPRERVFVFNGVMAYSLDFELRQPMEELGIEQITARLPDGPLWLYTDEEGQRKLMDAGFRVTVESSHPNYPVTRINGAFLNPATRAGAVKMRVVLRVDPALPVAR